MAQTLPTETVIENELQYMDNRHIRDLALIGLDKVKAGSLAKVPKIDDRTIEDLKSSRAD
jgi:hypothetical protein